MNFQCDRGRCAAARGSGVARGQAVAGSQGYFGSPNDGYTSYYPLTYIFISPGTRSDKPTSGSAAKLSGTSPNLSGQIYQQLLDGIKTHFDKLKRMDKSKITQETKLTMEEFERNYEGLKAILTDENLLFIQQKDEINLRLEQMTMNKSKVHSMNDPNKKHSHSEKMAFELSKSESALENINIRARPTVVAESYEHMCTTEWHNAKQALDKEPFQETKKLELLADILKESEQVATEARDNAMNRLDKLINDPLDPEKKAGASKGTVDEGDLVPKLHVILSDVWREGSGDIDIQNLIEEVRRRLTQQHPDNMSQALKHKEVKDYLEACVRLTWMMVLQRPAMLFQEWKCPREFKPEMEEPAWGSDDPLGSKVKGIMYPALFQKDYLMVKGKVLLKKT